MISTKEKYRSGKAEQEQGRGTENKHENLLSILRHEVDKFNSSFGFNIRILSEDPSLIDGSARPSDLVFVLVREDALLSSRTYCLYAILREQDLRGYIGISRNGSIKTVKELKPLKDYSDIKDALYEWLRQLLHASFEKITL